MPKGPKGEKRPADVVGAAVKVMKIATGEIEEDVDDDSKNKAAVALGRKGRLSDAEKSLDQARRIEPSVSMKHMREYWGTADQKSFEIYFDGFRKAGLTE